MDGDYGSTNIEIVLEKHGTTQTSIDNIVVNQTLFDIGHGTIFVLQLVGVSLMPPVFVLLFYRILGLIISEKAQDYSRSEHHGL